MKYPSYCNERGSALVITLAMVVLLAFVLVAFFVRSTSSLSIEKASSGGREALLLTQSAANLIISDLQSEMRAFSTPAGDTYFPNSNKDMLPERRLLSGGMLTDQNFVNLVKQSGVAMFDGSPTIDVTGGTATDIAGPDGRKISASRWSAPMLLGADLLETPRWIYINRDGSLANNVSADTIGRFAYNVYEVGGLLDINAAGFAPAGSGSTPNLVATKGGLIWADLRSIPGIAPNAYAANMAWPPQWRINRDWSTIGTDADLSLSWYQASGWLEAYMGAAGASSDQMFASRQDLIRFAKNNPGTFLENASGFPYALQYLTTFSRDVNQPTYQPPADRPKVRFNQASGGSDAIGRDDQINPGSRSSTSGESLIKRRFALEHLKLLETPGADPAEIRQRFGLTKSGNVWVYNHGNVSQILNLEDIPADREPDFFEVLKAAIHAGSLAVQHGTSLAFAPNENVKAFYRPSLGVDDGLLDSQIIQIGANIIDQADDDSYPTQIEFNGDTFYGVENLPYIDAVACVSLPEEILTGLTAPIGFSGVGNWSDGEGRVKALKAITLLMPRLWNPHSGNPGDQNKVPTQFRIRAVTSASGQSHFVQARHDGNNANIPAGDPWNNSSPGAGGIGAAYRYNYSDIRAGENYAPEGPQNPAAGLDQSEIQFTLAPNWQSTFPNTLSDPEILSHLYTGTAFSDISGTPGVTQFSTISPWIQNGFGKTSSATALAAAAYPVFGFPVGRSWMGPYVAQGNTRKALNSVIEVHGGPVKMILECQDDSGNWIPYDTAYYLTFGTSVSDINNKPDSYYALTDVSTANGDADRGNLAIAIDGQAIPTYLKFDPRSKRWGGVMANAGFLGRGAKAQERLQWQHHTMPARSTLRPTATGTPSLSTHPQGVHYFPLGLNSFDLNADDIWQANTNSVDTKQLSTINIANIVINNGEEIGGTTYSYVDPDEIRRRGMGAYWSGNSLEGQPMATVAGNILSDVAKNRPIILNRPFRSVAELGYVFRDTPWRNLDFFTKESGDAALLDFFCIHDITEDKSNGRSAVLLTREEAPIVAGKVNLNTPHAEVLAALIRGVNRENQTNGADSIAETEALNIGQGIVDYTSSTDADKGPFESLADLIGRPVSSTEYEGFSDELDDILTLSSDLAVKQRREAVIRALVDSGGVRTWNVLIDVIAQAGIVTPDGTRFIPQGERRIWASTAIDRFTTEVVGKQWEIVHE